MYNRVHKLSIVFLAVNITTVSVYGTRIYYCHLETNGIVRGTMKETFKTNICMSANNQLDFYTYLKKILFPSSRGSVTLIHSLSYKDKLW